ncbi:MAG TPA: polysaccharide deacetylase family protein [Ktedonobacterales bacterium]
MQLVGFSIKTKGLRNFIRRLRTVFTRFDFSGARARETLMAILTTAQSHGAAPTFFVPAVVLRRHPKMLAGIARAGAEMGVHGYVHNDYRLIPKQTQFEQTWAAMRAFRSAGITFSGFRNPYLGWSPASVAVYDELRFSYDSNEAIIHDVIDPKLLPPTIRASYAKSLALFQALQPSAYALRPHTEGRLVRIPTSIPDDEMLFDRLRITNTDRLATIWCEIMRRVYALGGIYALNVHPERGKLCQPAYNAVLVAAKAMPQPMWLTRLDNVADWWRERAQARLDIRPAGAGRWQVDVSGPDRLTVLVRHLDSPGTEATPWHGHERRVLARSFVVAATLAPMIAVSARTPCDVLELLTEQGFPYRVVDAQEGTRFSLWLDLPDGLGDTREKRMAHGGALTDTLEALESPLVRIGIWPNGARAACSLTGDIDSVTIQDFFHRILEVRRTQ